MKKNSIEIAVITCFDLTPPKFPFCQHYEENREEWLFGFDCITKGL